MGKIYLAEHDRLGRKVAVKVIRPDRASAETRDRFRREQAALARLHQTHIVSIYAAGEEGPLHYFAMPYIEGAALRHVVEAAGRETAGSLSKTPTLGELAEKLVAVSDYAGEASTAAQVPLGPPTPPQPRHRPLKLRNRISGPWPRPWRTRQRLSITPTTPRSCTAT